MEVSYTNIEKTKEKRRLGDRKWGPRDKSCPVKFEMVRIMITASNTERLLYVWHLHAWS